jgi:hypothetical protein
MAVDENRTAVSFNNIAHDRQPEAAAARVTRPRLVDPGESLEDPLALVGWYPRSVVGHPQLRHPIGFREVEGHETTGMARRIAR